MLYLTSILTMLYLTHDIRHRYLSCYTYYLISDTGICHTILNTWYRYLHRHMIYNTDTCHAIPDPDIWHRYLPCYIWHMIPNTDTCHAIFDTWYLTPVLAMLYLTHDIWHRYLLCYTWPWYMTPVLAMLNLTLIYNTGTCHDTPGTYIIWHIHDFYVTRQLALLYLLYSCTPVSPVLIYLLYSCSW